MSATYHVSPSFDIPVDGPLSLGHIIVDPKDPTYSLNPKDRVLPLDSEAYTSKQVGFEASRGAIKNGHAGFWMKFLEISSFGAEGNMSYDKQTDDIYSTNKIETSFFVPTHEYLEKTMASPPVARYIKARRWKATLYIVTGIKAAYGLKVTNTQSDAVATNMKASAKAGSLPVGAGTDAGMGNEHNSSTSYKSTKDIVFAFQLRKVIYQEGKAPKQSAVKAKGGMFEDDASASVSVIQSTEVVGLSEEDVGADDLKLDGVSPVKVVEDNCIWVTSTTLD